MQVETNGGLEERPRPLEQRLATLAAFGAEILTRWSANADRHAAAVAQLEAHLRELKDAGSQLQHDAEHRLANLERIVQQEWDALRQLHEAPVRQLVQQAAYLTEVCIATANSAQTGFDRSEARLSAIEGDFHRTTSDLTREIHAALAELRSLSQAAPRQLPGEAPAWPLDDVTRLHQQLRETDSPSTPGRRALPGAQTNGAQSHEVLTHTVSDIPAASSPVATPNRRLAFAGLVAAVVLVIAASAFIWKVEQDVRASAARVDEAQRQLRAAADASARQLADRQAEATRQLDIAQQLATRAQTIGDVLAAPDLVRFPLVGRDALTTASGQMLWSRSRGFVFSVSGVPAPPQDATYQLWFVTRTGPVSGGTFVPDAAGRATVADTAQRLAPLVGAIVTMEPKGGGQSPSGEPLLARAPLPPPGS